MSSPDLPPELDELVAADTWKTFRETNDPLQQLIMEQYKVDHQTAWTLLLLMDACQSLRLLLEHLTSDDDDEDEDPYGN